jgi:hypothetical protein
MKKLIHEVNENSGSCYQIWAEIIHVENPLEHKQLIFSSVWTGAKNSKEHQRKCEFLLSPDALDNLKELLEQQ